MSDRIRVVNELWGWRWFQTSGSFLMSLNGIPFDPDESAVCDDHVGCYRGGSTDPVPHPAADGSRLHCGYHAYSTLRSALGDEPSRLASKIKHEILAFVSASGLTRVHDHGWRALRMKVHVVDTANERIHKRYDSRPFSKEELCLISAEKERLSSSYPSKHQWFHQGTPITTTPRTTLTPQHILNAMKALESRPQSPQRQDIGWTSTAPEW